MVLVRLFLAFFRIGLFSIGGAYSFLPMIEREVVERYSWLAKEEFLDIMGFSRVFPGAISIKFATYTGYKIAGIPGVIVANFGNFFAPAAMIILLSAVYAKYKDLPRIKSAFGMLHLVVFALIIAVAFKLINVNHLIQLKGFLTVVIAFILFTYTKVHPALIITAAALIGLFLKP
ncbi:MAG: chromate transporter [Omnitrophica bacterium]|nr:chromate transporter [Candidatus Omnitrophota bacterium]